MNTVYEIRIKETNAHIRDFVGDSYLDMCLSTWTRLLGKEVIAVEKGTAEIQKNEFLEIEELFYFIRDLSEQYAMYSTRVFGKATAAFDLRDLNQLRHLKQVIVLGHELFEMQSLVNEGRGNSTVRQVASELIRDDLEGAKIIAYNGWDKIRSHEDLATFLKQNKIAEEDW